MIWLLRVYNYSENYDFRNSYASSGIVPPISSMFAIVIVN